MPDHPRKLDLAPHPTSDAIVARLLALALQPHQVALPVLGHLVMFESNSPELLDIAEATFRRAGETGDEAGDPSSLRRGLCVRIAVVDGDEGDAPTVEHLALDAERLLVRSPASAGVCDPARRLSVAQVTSALMADRAQFSEQVLEALTLALVSSFDRHPLHAAAIGRDRRALLLHGASGSGKSTLAYLAHSAGLSVIGDDLAWVQLHPAMRIWGRRQAVRLLPEVVRYFEERSPEARAPLHAAIGTSRGKTVLPLDPRAGAPSSVYDAATVCLLRRGGASAELERIDAEEVALALRQDVAPGFDRFPARHHEVTARLAAGGGWRLTLSPDPADALVHLETMLS